MTDAREIIAPEHRIGLSRTQAASLIGVSPNTFDAMVDRGHMPKAIRIGARRIWARPALEAAFNALSTGDGSAKMGDGGTKSGQTVDRRPPWERRAS